MHQTVSFLIASFNALKTISSCLDSILSVLNEGDEIIICDLSNDGTRELLQQKYLRPFIHVIDSENKGIYVDRVKLLHFAKCNYCFFIDSDDLLFTEKWSLLRSFLDSKPVDMVFCDAFFRNRQKIDSYCPLFSFDVNDVSLSKDLIIESFMTTTRLNPLWRCLFRRSLIGYIQDSDFSFQIRLGEDRDIMLNLISVSDSFSLFKQPVYIYIIYSSSATRNLSEHYVFDSLFLIDSSLRYFHCHPHPKKFFSEFIDTIGKQQIFQAIATCYKCSTTKKGFMSLRSSILLSSAYCEIMSNIDKTHLTKKEKTLLFLFLHHCFWIPKIHYCFS